MKTIDPHANVTLKFSVGGMKPGTRPMRFENKMKNASEPMIQKCRSAARYGIANCMIVRTPSINSSTIVRAERRLSGRMSLALAS